MTAFHPLLPFQEIGASPSSRRVSTSGRNPPVADPGCMNRGAHAQVRPLLVPPLLGVPVNTMSILLRQFWGKP
jgi:hypothetical protein